MTDLFSLLRACRENPNDPAQRLVTADKLEELGYEGQAEILRRLNHFIDFVGRKVAAYYEERFPGLQVPVVEVGEGPVYWRLASVDGGRSVYCFVRKDDGAILKAAGWRAPAKNGVRGWLGVPQDWDSIAGPYGLNYLR